MMNEQVAALRGQVSSRLMSRLGWLLAYVAAIGLVLGGLFYGRSQALATYSGAAAQTDWDQWRADATQMAQGAGPVKRRAPQSAEPPALVLMRDHFAACLGLAVLLSSVLFGTFMFFIRGALASGKRSPSRSLTPSATDARGSATRTSGPDGVGGLL